jgi:drug/metabolite transporter (DMT)-like permease
LVGLAALSLVVPLQWTPPTPIDWGLMFVTGFVAAIGHWGVLKAIELAPISILAPFSYSVMPSAVLIGYFVFGQVPDPVMLLGALIVCASGLAVGYRERAGRGG